MICLLKKEPLFYYSCSIDPTVIYVPINTSSLSIFHISFYLYHIIKEPIPFQIQCKILYYDDDIDPVDNIDCSSVFINTNHNDRSSMNKNDVQDYSYKLYRSSNIYVTRQLPAFENERQIFHSNTFLIVT